MMSSRITPVYETSAILKVLLDCVPALRWLSRMESTDGIPPMFENQIKQLERLAIVYRRNNQVLGVRKQRLAKLLARESQNLHTPYSIEDLLGSNRRVDKSA